VTNTPGPANTNTPTPVPGDCFGDVNGDGRVTGRDVAAVLLAWLKNRYNPNADLNNDGKVNFIDFKLVIKALIKHDCDNDGIRDNKQHKNNHDDDD
jgi:hypothetical protein